MTVSLTNCEHCGEPIRQVDGEPWRHVSTDDPVCPGAPVATPIPRTGGPFTHEPDYLA